MDKAKKTCPKCGSTNTRKRGFTNVYSTGIRNQRYYCSGCGRAFTTTGNSRGRPTKDGKRKIDLSLDREKFKLIALNAQKRGVSTEEIIIELISLTLKPILGDQFPEHNFSADENNILGALVEYGYLYAGEQSLTGVKPRFETEDFSVYVEPCFITVSIKGHSFCKPHVGNPYWIINGWGSDNEIFEISKTLADTKEIIVSNIAKNKYVQLAFN